MMENCLQLLLVLTPSWEAVNGKMFCFERESIYEQFRLVGSPIQVVVGERGMAWGRGCYVPNYNQEQPCKREGDKKSPAGFFELGPVFIDNRFPVDFPLKMPFISVGEGWEAVDDPNSLYYNQIVETKACLVKDWKSSEEMQRADELYRQGIVIRHNTSPVISGLGSCIFFHIWRSREKGTAGCTAMDSLDLARVLKWLNADKLPSLLQLPLTELHQIKQNLNMNVVDFSSCLLG